MNVAASGLWRWTVLLACVSTFVAHAANAQAPAEFQLVRCGPDHAAQCLAARIALTPGTALGTVPGDTTRWRATLSGATMLGAEQRRISGSEQPDVTPVFGAPVLAASALARASLRGTVTLTSREGATLSIPARWRPPLIAAPAFLATADSMAVPPAIRDALNAGGEPPSVRPMVALVLLLLSGVMIVFVPRFAWRAERENEEDMAQRIASARALLSTQELEELRGKAPQEAKGRSPDDPTHQITIMKPPI